MVIETLLQEHRAVAAVGVGAGDPGDVGGAPPGVLEAGVQVGELYERLRGRVGRDAARSVRDGAPVADEVLHDEDEGVVAGSWSATETSGTRKRRGRRELRVEARLTRPHPGATDQLATRRVQGRHLAEHLRRAASTRRVTRRVIGQPEPHVRVRDLVDLDDLDRRDAHTGMARGHGPRHPFGVDLVGCATACGHRPAERRVGAGHVGPGPRDALEHSSDDAWHEFYLKSNMIIRPDAARLTPTDADWTGRGPRLRDHWPLMLAAGSRALADLSGAGVATLEARA